MRDKVVNTYSFAFDSVSHRYKTQEMCDRVVYENHFLIVYCPDKYKTRVIYIGLLQVKLLKKTFYCLVCR